MRRDRWLPQHSRKETGDASTTDEAANWWDHVVARPSGADFATMLSKSTARPQMAKCRISWTGMQCERSSAAPVACASQSRKCASTINVATTSEITSAAFVIFSTTTYQRNPFTATVVAFAGPHVLDGCGKHYCTLLAAQVVNVLGSSG